MATNNGKAPSSALHEVVSDLMYKEVALGSQLTEDLRAAGADPHKVNDALHELHAASVNNKGNEAATRAAHAKLIRTVRAAGEHPRENIHLVSQFLQDKHTLHEFAVASSGVSQQQFVAAYNTAAPELLPLIAQEVAQSRAEQLREMMDKVVVKNATAAMNEPAADAVRRAAPSVEQVAGNAAEAAVDKAANVVANVEKLAAMHRAGLGGVALGAAAGGMHMLRSSSEQKDDSGEVKRSASAFKKVAGVVLLAVAAAGSAAVIRAESPVATLKKTFGAATSWVEKAKLKEGAINTAKAASNGF